MVSDLDRDTRSVVDYSPSGAGLDAPVMSTIPSHQVNAGASWLLWEIEVPVFRGYRFRALI